MTAASTLRRDIVANVEGHHVDCGVDRAIGHSQPPARSATDRPGGSRGHCAPAAPAAQVAARPPAWWDSSNDIVTNLLNPFLGSAHHRRQPVDHRRCGRCWPGLRRNLFNQAPTINYDPDQDMQTGQTITGKIGATDPEGDALTYTVTQAPQEHGTI